MVQLDRLIGQAVVFGPVVGDRLEQLAPPGHEHEFVQLGHQLGVAGPQLLDAGARLLLETEVLGQQDVSCRRRDQAQVALELVELRHLDHAVLGDGVEPVPHVLHDPHRDGGDQQADEGDAPKTQGQAARDGHFRPDCVHDDLLGDGRNPISYGDTHGWSDGYRPLRPIHEGNPASSMRDGFTLPEAGGARSCRPEARRPR